MPRDRKLCLNIEQIDLPQNFGRMYGYIVDRSKYTTHSLIFEVNSNYQCPVANMEFNCRFNSSARHVRREHREAGWSASRAIFPFLSSFLYLPIVLFSHFRISFSLSFSCTTPEHKHVIMQLK